MDWILDNYIIVAGIVFFILSSLGKFGKGGDDSKPARMPTFGGGDDSTGQGPRPGRAVRPGQQVRPVEPRPVNASPANSTADNRPQGRFQDEEEEEFDPYYQEGERAHEPSLDNETRYQLFSESDDPHEARDSMEQRKRNMQAELDRIHKHLDRMTSHIPETILEVSETDVETRQKQSKFAEQARNGVIWSEILGPPRSKRPMGRRQ